MPMNWRKAHYRSLIIRKRTRILRRGILLTYLALQCNAAHPAEPVWQGEPMHYVARNSRLADVLTDVAAAGGLRLDATRAVRGDVNGVFDQTPAAVFRTLAEAWGLVWFFDGQTIHVSTPDDVRSRTLPFAPLTRDDVTTLLRNLELDDPHLPLRFAKDSVKVVGPSRYVDAVTDAIAKALDQHTPAPASLEQTQIRVFPLRYAQAQDITYNSGGHQQTIPGVASLLRQLMENTSAPQSTAAARVKGRPSLAKSSRGGVPPLPSLPGLGEIAQPDAAVADDPPSLPPTALTPARRNIIADARTNAVVVYDVPEMMPAYQRAIAMLDRPQDLVEISAVVMDVSSDAARELGIRWGAGAASSRPATPPYGALMPALPGVLPLAADAGINLTTLIGDSAHYLYEQIHALEQTGRARILSRPRVLTLNNAEAVLSSRNSVYVRVAGNQDANLFNVDTGLTLKVTPTVEQGGSDRNAILLSVQIEDGSFDSDATVDGIPRVNNNSIITQAVVGDGESLLIGGYDYERSQTNASKVPFLGDIPLIGSLFRNERTAVDRSERLILITPQVRRANAVRNAPAAASVAPANVVTAPDLAPARLNGPDTNTPAAGAAAMRPALPQGAPPARALPTPQAVGFASTPAVPRGAER